MPYQRHGRVPRQHAPADRLARAIGDIDRRLEQLRLTDQPAPLSAYRARQILKEAYARCRERAEAPTEFPFGQAAPPDATPGPQRSRGNPAERHEALPDSRHLSLTPQDFGGCLERMPETDLRFRKCDCGSHDDEGIDMAYDWTGETRRKRNRVKLAAAILLSLAIVLGIPVAVSPFL